MNVSAGCLTGYRVLKRVVRNVMVDEILQQPLAFRLIRMHGYVNASAVVEAKCAMDRGLSHRAYRQWLAELFLEIGLDMGEADHVEHTVALVVGGEVAGRFGLVCELGIQRLFGLSHAGKFRGEARARLREVVFLLREIQI